MQPGPPGAGAGRPLANTPAPCRFRTENEALLDELVSQADVVISMLPAALHPLVARACVRHGRHLATASYVSPEIRALHDEAAAAGMTLLMECGLDPGLDHMSAMRAIEHIRARGGRLTSFQKRTAAACWPRRRRATIPGNTSLPGTRATWWWRARARPSFSKTATRASFRTSSFLAAPKP